MLYFIIFLPIVILWFLFCFILSIGGLFIPQTDFSKVEGADKKETVCKSLNKKGLLTNKEYSFETDHVATQYDKITFDGYFFIMKPIIFSLNNFNFLDQTMLWFVRKWMSVQKFLIYQEGKPKKIYILITYFCVLIAKNVGLVINFFL